MTLTSTDNILFIEIIGNPDKSKNRLNVSYCGETTTLINIYELTVFLKGFIFTLIGLDPSIPDHESIGTTEDMDHHSTDDEGTITEEHINPTVL